MQATLLVGTILALAVLMVALPVGRQLFRRLRGPRIVVCPETRQPTEIELDAGLGAVTGVLAGKPELRILRCERWREGHQCGEACLEGVGEAALAGRGLLVGMTGKGGARATPG
jgi:hypothetical protein